MIAQTLENATVTEDTQAPLPIRVIRRVNGKYQYVVLQSEAELTEAERREIYCSMFQIYGE